MAVYTIPHEDDYSPDVASRDRRRYRRQRLGTVGVLFPPIGGGATGIMQVHVIDVSSNGLGFRAPAGFRRGSLYQMRIGTGPLQISSRLRIISSRQRLDGTHDVGAEFF